MEKAELPDWTGADSLQGKNPPPQKNVLQKLKAESSAAFKNVGSISNLSSDILYISE